MNLEASIEYFFEATPTLDLQEEQYTNWITKVIESFGYQLSQINYIFCSDEYLLAINQEHLDHDYYTDIITFDLSDGSNRIESDIFISIDRVAENAKEQKIDFFDELKRVMIHGVIHLTGQGDKTEQEIIDMRKKEDASLSLWSK